jgi:hypothetical protein
MGVSVQPKTAIDPNKVGDILGDAALAGLGNQSKIKISQ